MKYAIVGAGFTGLTAAYDLIKAGHQVTIFESASQAGGLAAGFKESHWDWYLEKYYHHWFNSDRALKQLLRQLKLSRRLIYSRPKTVVYTSNNFYPLDSPLAILTFPHLRFPDRMRFATVTAYLKYLASWQTLEPVTAVSWLKHHYGSHIYHLIWAPLLEGKFGPYSQQVTMAWMWARLKARTPSLGTYAGGFQAFINDFTATLHQLGVKCYLNAYVSNLKPLSSGISLSVAQKSYHFDSVLLTTSPQIAVRLAPSLSPDYLAQLLHQPYLGAVMLILSLKQSLSPQKYYWYNLPKNHTFPFLALVEHTHFVSPKHFGGDHIIYCGDYVSPNDPYLSLSHQELLAAFIPGIQKINPLFHPSWIKKSWVFKTAYAQPVPGINQSRLIPPINSPVKGLYYAGLAQVYPWDRGTNFAIDLGRRAASIMLSS